MHYCLLLIVSVLVSGTSYSQSLSPVVYASGGQTAQNGNVRLEYTIGEPLTNSYSVSDAALTQGFHQPDVTIVGLEEWQGASVQLYPNPVAEELILVLPNDVYTACTITDAVGKTVYSSTVTTTEEKINVNFFSTGVYTILLKGKEETILRFIKH